MTLFVRVAAAACASLAAWLSWGALALTDEPFPLRLGFLPPAWTLGAATVVAICLVLALRPAGARLLPLFFSGILVLPWLPGPVPAAFLVWVRPVTWGVWGAIGVAMLVAGHRPRGSEVRRPWSWARDPRRAPIVIGAVAWGACLALALQFSAIRPSGDEPHYLVITQSLLSDGDLRIENNHARGDYRAYFGYRLPPHSIRRGRDGQIYSHHPPGLPALLVPAFAIGGYPGAVVFLTAVAGVGLALAWRLAWRLTGDVGAAWFGTLAVGLSPPVVLHAFAVFPELPASVIVLTGFWALTLTPDEPARRWLLHGALVALLPWLHPRYAVMAGALAVAVAIRVSGWSRRGRPLVAFLAVPAVSAACWFGLYWWIYGRPDPTAPTGRLNWSLASLPTGLTGVLFDQQFGFVANAPVALIAGVGVLRLLLGGRRADGACAGPSWRFTGLALLGVLGPYLIVTGWWRMWWGGDNAPARFLAAIGLPLVLPTAAGWTALRARADRAVAAALLGVTVLATLAMVGVDGGRLAYNWRDGFARVLEWAGPLADLSRTAPSLFRHPPGHALAGAAVWGAALALLWACLRVWDRGERCSTGALALMTLGLGGAAVMAGATAGWRLDGASGVRPNASRAAAVRAYDARIHRTGLVIGRTPSDPGPALLGMRPAAPSGLVRRLDLATEARQGPRPPVVLGLGWLPAGTYLIQEAWPGGPAPALEVAISPRGPAIDARPPERAAGGPAGRAWRLTLPVDVGGLVVRGQPGAAASSEGAVRLVPDALLARDARATSGRATNAVRFGTTRVFVIDEGAYAEPAGVWVRPDRVSELLVALDAPASALQLFLRNAPVGNRVEVRAGAWQVVLDLPPGGEREVTIPVSARRLEVTLRLRAATGFRPAEVDATSHDERRLACWVEVRRPR